MAVRIEFASPGFFAIPLKKVEVEDTGTGRVYFVHKGRIVAVGIRKEARYGRV